MAAKGLLIGGDRVTDVSGGHYAHHNPATGQVQAQVPMGGAADIDNAVVAARDALPAWRAMPVNQRGAILHKLSDLLEQHSEHSGEHLRRTRLTPAGHLQELP
jgi:aldehyde dehydrogenase (NAD+)